MSGETVTIRLGAAPATDAFGLDITIAGAPALETVRAAGPGLFRRFEPAATGLVRQGWLIGFLQRGPLRLPVAAPCDGYVLATAADGARVEHGTPLVRLLRASQDMTP